MSKTNKIRRLKRQVEQLSKDLWMEKFTNKRLMRDSAICPKPFRMEDPPEIRSINYYEEQCMNRLMHYIYKQMENEYQICYDLDPYCDHTKHRFELYLDYDTFCKMRNISGLGLWEVRQDGDYFRGHKVLVVNAREIHVRLVRVK